MMKTLGDKVEVYDNGKWRLAVLVKHKPYYHRSYGSIDGYDVYYITNTEVCPISKIRPTQGGWKPINYIRPIT